MPVWNLLPKTDLIVLRPLANQEEADADPDVDFEFLPAVCVPWQNFVEVMGDWMQPQGHYPERYYLDCFPGDDEWPRLLPHRRPLPTGFVDG
jgi:hypothetical protein